MSRAIFVGFEVRGCLPPERGVEVRVKARCMEADDADRKIKRSCLRT